MKKNIFLILCFCLFFKIFAFAQPHIEVRTVCKLPDVLMESSGLYIPSPDSIWSHGDSGNPPNLYLMDTTGKVLRTVNVRGVPNVDWEELGKDDYGNLYIGDFGNNKNDRRDLVIYKIPNFRALRMDTVNPQVIRFSYEDQKEFPPPVSNQVYDCESMLVFDDSIFVATKDYHAKPYTGITRIYKMLNASGTHIAKFVAQVSTDPVDKQYGGITGMTMSADKKKVILISHNQLFLAEGFEGRAFWTVPWKKTLTSPLGKREGVAFKDACTLYLSEDNGSSGVAGNLYTFDFCRWRSLVNTTVNINTISGGKYYPNPSGAGDNVTIVLNKSLDEKTTVVISDDFDKVLSKFKVDAGADKIVIPSQTFPGAGVYFVHLKHNKITFKIVRK